MEVHLPKRDQVKRITARKDLDFSNWYQQVIIQSGFIEYYDVKGCYILRENAFAIWETIQQYIDKRLKQMGVKNVYFPLFIPKKSLEKEEKHIEGFSPEVAWITHAGQSPLDQHIAIRPTSETAMYPYYSRWIRSHRDLPLKLNQWNNVVRWEFEAVMPLIRSREFLWQEGHSAYATCEAADEEVLQILDLYNNVYEELLSIPVIKGKKSEREKFAGANYTTSLETFIVETGKAIQAATSHSLGQNFSRIFNIEYEQQSLNDYSKVNVWQNSWGFSTRSLGIMVMMHGDNKGLFFPPRVAPIQLVIVPCYNSLFDQETCDKIVQLGKKIETSLREAGIRAYLDDRDNYTAGYKFYHWELCGVPLRIDIGPREVEQNKFQIIRRDANERTNYFRGDTLVSQVNATIEKQQKQMLEAARMRITSNIQQVENWDNFMKAIYSHRLILAPWCCKEACEDTIRNESKQQSGAAAKSLCIPFAQPQLSPTTKCFKCMADAKHWTFFGRSY